MRWLERHAVVCLFFCWYLAPTVVRGQEVESIAQAIKWVEKNNGKVTYDGQKVVGVLLWGYPPFLCVADLSPLSTFGEHLQSLNVSRNAVQDLAPLATLTGLKKLTLYDAGEPALQAQMNIGPSPSGYAYIVEVNKQDTPSSRPGG